MIFTRGCSCTRRCNRHDPKTSHSKADLSNDRLHVLRSAFGLPSTARTSAFVRVLGAVKQLHLRRPVTCSVRQRVNHAPLLKKFPDEELILPTSCSVGLRPPPPRGQRLNPCSSIRIRQGNATAPTHQNASHSVSATEFLSVESLVTNRSKCYEPGNTIQSNRGENEPSSRAEM